jgi:glycosyltransferase involved in cell wall biosynthesis
MPVDEIIACDDGSTDETVSLLRAFAADSRCSVNIVENARRLGVTRNFQQAISLCAGRTILLCDQDDCWHVDKVRVLAAQLESHSADLAFSNAQVVLRDLQPAGYRLWDSIWFDEAEQRRVREGDALPVLLRHAVSAGSTLAFNSEYLPLILPIPDLPHCHDIWITLLLACVGRIEPVDQDLIQYRLHGANAVGMQRYNLLGQIRMAQQQIRTNAFSHLAELYTAAHERLSGQTRWPVRPAALKLLQDKTRHSQLRHDLPRRWLKRLSIVGGELRRGNYLKYSYGYKSVLQDLFLR